jgi:hypothetical protein
MLTHFMFSQVSIAATVNPVGSLLQQIYLLWNTIVLSLASAEDLIYSFTFQPLAVNMLNAGPLNGGNVLGLDSSGGPLVALTLTVQYSSADWDSLIQTTTRALFTEIQALASKTGDLNLWIYLN